MLLPGAADTIRVLLKRMVAVDSDAVAAVVIEARTPSVELKMHL